PRAVEQPTQAAPVASAQAPPAPAPKPALGALRKKAEAAPPDAVAGDLPSRDELTTAWGDVILAKLARKVSVWVKGRFAAVEDGAAVFALEDTNFLARAEKYQPDVEAALAAHFGRPVLLRLTVDYSTSAPTAQAEA